MKHNIEEQYKNHIDQKEIQPTEMSWNKLESMLSQDKKSNKFGWIYIAASIVGILLVGTVFLYSTSEMIDHPVQDSMRKDGFVNSDSIKENPFSGELSNFNSEVEKIENQTVESRKSIDSSNNSNQNIELQNVHQSLTSENILLPDNTLAANNSSENNIQPEAQKTVKVNSRSLLNQVDGEVEEVYRETVIQKVSRNLQEVKLVLGTRNQE